MKKRMGTVGLRQVDFHSKDDHRLRVFGMPLDHLFYRGLFLAVCSIIVTSVLVRIHMLSQYVMLKLHCFSIL